MTSQIAELIRLAEQFGGKHVCTLFRSPAGAEVAVTAMLDLNGESMAFFTYFEQPHTPAGSRRAMRRCHRFLCFQGVTFAYKQTVTTYAGREAEPPRVPSADEIAHAKPANKASVFDLALLLTALQSWPVAGVSD